MKTYHPEEEQHFLEQIPVGSIWQHYSSTDKDKRDYEVVGFCRNESDTELFVLYKPMYKAEFPIQIPWARSAKDFLAKLADGRPRFKQLK